MSDPTWQPIPIHMALDHAIKVGSLSQNMECYTLKLPDGKEIDFIDDGNGFVDRTYGGGGWEYLNNLVYGKAHG